MDALAEALDQSQRPHGPAVAAQHADNALLHRFDHGLGLFARLGRGFAAEQFRAKIIEFLLGIGK